MELHAENVACFQHRRIRNRVGARRSRGIVQWRVVTMSEVEIWMGREIPQQLRTIQGLNLIPSHVRHASVSRKTPDLPLKQAKPPLFGRFFARFEQALQSQANPQKWDAGANALQQRVTDLQLIECAHHLPKVADAGENDF